MPSYYYHLAFELYQQSLSGIRKPFIPASNLDIFTASLPSHSEETWTSVLAPRKDFRRTRSSLSNTDGAGTDNHWVSRGRSASRSKRASKPLAIREKKLEVVAVEKKDTGDSSGHHCDDWRRGKLSIDSINMDTIEPLTRSETRPTQRPNAPGATQPLTAKYTPTNPNTTEFGWGVVHLYRDELETVGTEHEEIQLDEDAAFLDKDGTTLCILAVPSYMTHSDVLGWVGEDTREAVSHFRLIRTNRSNRFMVLMKFRESEAARKWQKDWNGKLFNSMEPENAHIVFIKTISFQTTEVTKDPQSFPDMSNDPFTPAIARTNTNTSLSTTSDPFTTPALIELPTCPVCLERMDETTGLATIFCQHVFHCACLQKWRGSGCPVCRYTQNDPLYKAKATFLDESACRTCGATSNLWICLICGSVGCGRYDEAHAQEHYQQTGHAFAMDLNDQHIWDYEGDNYVHRLLQDKSNGKLVELPAAFSSTRSNNHDMEDLPWEKVEKMSYEYSTLITSQLDSQRLYFEEQIDRAADKAAKAAAAEAAANEAALHASCRMLEIESSHSRTLDETLPGLEKEKARLERRAEKAEQLARQMRKDAQEKEAMNESLLQRVKLLQAQVEELARSKSEAEETNRDLMAYVSCIEKLKDAGEDVQEGTVIVGEAPGKKKKKGKK